MTMDQFDRALTLAFKVAFAICTMGLYPVIPWIHRGINGTIHERDVRREAYRMAIRRDARARLNGR